MIEELLIDPEHQVLTLHLTDGRCVDLTGTSLRLACKCAFCEADRRKGVPPTAPPGLRIVGLEPMGSGIHLKFSDGHARGIYPFAYLVELSNALAPASQAP